MIRWKVFIPAFLLIGLITWFVLFRLDIFVKGTIEDGISAITGTKTDITRLRISLLDSRLTIQRLEIGSSSEPMNNTVEFGDIRIDFQFLPILAKRFVVDEFSMTDIQWGTPRRTSALLPPRPKSKPGMFSEITDQAVDSLVSEFEKLPVAKLADFEIPNNPREIVERLDLQSVEAFKKATLEAQEMKARWEGKWKDLRDISEYKRLVADSKALVQNLPQDPQEILSRVSKAQEILQRLEAEKKKAETLVSDVRQEFSQVEATLTSATQAVESDYSKAKSLVGFDAFDTSTLTKMIFGKEWIDRAERVIRASMTIRANLARMSAAGKDESIQVTPRAKGRDIVFVTPMEKPSFVLAKSDFSVNALEDGDRKRVNQHYKAVLRDINSAPRLYGKPTTVDLSAEFKDMQVGSAHLSALWDYTKEVPRDIYKAEAKRIKAADWPVGIPKFFPIRIQNGEANAVSNFEFVGASLTWTNRVSFSGVTWDFTGVPKSGVIIPILQDVFRDVKNFQLTFKLTHEDKALKFSLVSDLDELLKAGVTGVLNQKFQEFQARMKREIDDRVAAVKAQALDQVAKVQSGVVGRAEKALSEASQSVTEGNQVISSLQQKAKDAASKKAGDQIKQVLPKGIKLPGGMKF